MRSELESKFNINALREEKEAEISQLVEKLDGLKNQIGEHQVKVD